MASLTESIEQSEVAVPSELPGYLGRVARIAREFVVFDDGYRGWTYSYAEMARMAGTFAARLHSEGIRKGETVMIWSENRPG